MPTVIPLFVKRVTFHKARWGFYPCIMLFIYSLKNSCMLEFELTFYPQRAVTMSLIDNDVSILTFGIYGRDYSLDMNPPDSTMMNLNSPSTGTNHHSASIFTLILSYLIFKLILN